MTSDTADRVIPPVILPVTIISLIFVGLIQLPIQGVVILGGAAIAAYIAWLLTTYKNPVQSRRVIHIYLLAVALQTIHLGEEYLGGFGPRITDLFNSDIFWSQSKFLVPFVFVGVPLWILAALAMSYKIPIVNALGNYMAWFYALGAGLINAIAHFIFPILSGGYFPGLYTAPLHLIMSLILIRALLVENKVVRQRQSGTGGEAAGLGLG